MSTSTTIPAIWRIDVEPDEHSPPVGQRPWEGFLETAALVDRVRNALADHSGHAVNPTWMMRLDPDVERCFGRLDFVVRRHRDVFDQLIDFGDPMGIHVHPFRWDAQQGVPFSDHADTAWTIHCLAVAVDAFKNSFGRSVRHSSQGGYFLTEALLDAMVAHGIEVEMTVEPGLAPRRADVSFGAYATAPSGDFRNCPRRPYYPSRQAYNTPSLSHAASRPILILPLTAYDYHTGLTAWLRRITRRLVRRPYQHTPLNPWKKWPSPKTYWDLVARAVEDQPVRYFAFASRTEAPGSPSFQRVRSLIEYLPEHPLAKRLQFVDPLGLEIRALAVP